MDCLLMAAHVWKFAQRLQPGKNQVPKYDLGRDSRCCQQRIRNTMF
jgi:hypothetical protein